mmetsp:Transcript_8967/g.22139  ORF Transcript_8967/g.22139 Transcript_8967/m.22139 type:complete len:217 (-) Transcript_8967:509-1159(-)
MSSSRKPTLASMLTMLPASRLTMLSAAMLNILPAALSMLFRRSRLARANARSRLIGSSALSTLCRAPFSPARSLMMNHAAKAQNSDTTGMMTPSIIGSGSIGSGSNGSDPPVGVGIWKAPAAAADSLITVTSATVIPWASSAALRLSAVMSLTTDSVSSAGTVTTVSTRERSLARLPKAPPERERARGSEARRLATTETIRTSDSNRISAAATPAM